jgi:hypothetical protein
MALDDIQIHSSPGSGPWIQYYQIEASQTFDRGDVVSLDNDGQVTEGAGELAPEDLLGIAMAGPAATAGTAGAKDNPRTGVAYADGDRFPVLIPRPTDQFITANWTTDSASFSDTVPDITDVGDVISLDVIGGVWGVEMGGTASSAVGVITDVLNVRKESIFDTGETLTVTDTFYIVFTINSHQHSATAEMIAGTG